MIRECPCRDCPDRKMGCHARCERYQGWKKDYEEYKEGKPDEFLLTNIKALRKHWKNLRLVNRRYRP